MAEGTGGNIKDRDSKGNLECSKHSPPIPESPAKGSPDSASALEAILLKLNTVHDIAQSTKTNMDLLQVEMAGIRNGFKELSIRVSYTETKISNVEDYTNKQIKHIQNLERSFASLRRDLTEQEDCNRSSNLCIFGVPEGIEHSAPSVIDLLITWIPNVLHLSFKKDFEIDRAHRVPSFKPRNMSPPRLMIFKPLQHQHTDQI